MSRKPIFNLQYVQPTLQSTVGRSADTRVASMKRTEQLLLNQIHNAPFSGFSTALQSAENNSFYSNKFDENNPNFQQILKHVNQLILEKQQAQETKFKEMQNQIDSNRSLIFDLRAQQNNIDNLNINKTITQYDESIKAKIQKAQDELIKQQGSFQTEYNLKLNSINEQTDQKFRFFQKEYQQSLVKLKEELQLKILPMQVISEDKTVKDLQQKIKDMQLLFDSLNKEFKLNDQLYKQQFVKLDNNQNEQAQKISVQEEQAIAQFRQFQNNYQQHITLTNKKLLEDIENKLQTLQLQTAQKQPVAKSENQNEITIQQVELDKITQRILEVQSSQKILSQQYQELSQRLDQYLNQYSKQEQLYKNLSTKVETNKNDSDNKLIEVKLELSSLTKQFDRLSQEQKNQYEILQEQYQRQSEEIRKSHQDLLFSFKQQEQNNWIEEFNKKKPEIQLAQVQVFSYDDGSESKSDKQETDSLDQNNQPEQQVMSRETFMNKLSNLSSSTNEVQEEKIVLVNNNDESIQSKLQQIDKNPFEDENAEENIVNNEEEDENENEATYQLDDQGYLLDQEGNYLLDENGQMIQLNETQIEYLKKQEMVIEEDI